MMNPTMVTRDVGQAMDRERIRKAQAFRTARAVGGEREGARRGWAALASVARTASTRVFTRRSHERREAVTTVP